MYCYKCGEENSEDAEFCKKCGSKLKKEETVKKAEFIETPISNQHANNSYERTTATSEKGSSGLTSCCLCLIAVFIAFAIIALF